MGDENTLAGVTKAHKHTSVSTDGGFLDANSITGFSNTNSGSILYIDGSNQATNLDVGNTGDTLTVSGSSLPEWAGAGATGSYQFVEKFTLGADTQFFETQLTDPYIYNDFDHLVLRYTLQAKTTSDGIVSTQLRYANVGTTYHTTNYHNIGCLLWNPTGVTRVYGDTACINLNPDTVSGGAGMNNLQSVSGEISFYNDELGNGTYYSKPFYFRTLKSINPLMYDGVGQHEDTLNRAELTSFQWTIAKDDYTVGAGTFEIGAGSEVTVYRVANS